MTKRLLGSLVIAGVLAVLLLGASVMLFSGSTQAQGQGQTPAMSNIAANEAAQPNSPLGVWATVAPFPTISIPPTPGTYPLRLKRAGAAAYVPNGKIYVMGGRHGIDGEDTTLRNIYEYTPGNPGTWLLKAALLDQSAVGSRFTANMAVAVLTDTNGVRIYAIGGNSIDSIPTDMVRVYNPVADTLSTLTSDPWPASPARVPGGWAVHNNKLYIFGGFSALGPGAVYSETWRFDPMAPAGTRWTQLVTANLPTPKGYTAGALLDGYIYAIGGDTWTTSPRSLVPTTDVVRMDPSLPAPIWASMASLPTARGDMGAWAYDTGAPYEIAGRIAIAGGPYLIPDNVGYLYNPGTDSWSAFPNLVKATRNYGYAQLNGFLYAFGGYDFTNNLPDGANFNQRYDATSPSSTSTPTLTGTVPTATRTPTLAPTNTGQPTSTPTSTITNTVAPPSPTTPPCGVLSEGFESGTLGQFTSVVGQCVPGGCGWTSTTTNPHSGTRSAFEADRNDITDVYLQLTNALSVASGAQLTFWHSYDLESSFDGGVLESSTNGGTTWQDMGPNIITGGYNDTISVNFGSPIAGRMAWSGSSGGYTQVTVNLTPYAGQSLRFRFRLATDNSVSDVGWNIDDIAVNGSCATGTPPTATNTAVVPTATRTNTPTNTTVPTSTSIPPSSTPAATATCIPAGSTMDVSIGSFFFNPQDLSIPAGTTVRWTNTDGSHSSTSDTAIWDSGILAVGGQFSYTFNTPGSYPYHCSVHPLVMTGTITVQAGGICATSTATRTNTAVPPTATSTNVPASSTATTQVATPTTEPTSCTMAFIDVPTFDEFYPYIRCLACRGIISGYDDGTFRPYFNIIRGQIAKIVSNSAGFSDPIPAGTQTFSDVLSSNPFYLWIERVHIHGTITGYPCGGIDVCDDEGRPYFHPYADATRGQLSKIVAIGAGVTDPVPAGQQTYADVLPASTFWLFIEQLTGRGVMGGYPCGGVNPQTGDPEPCDGQDRPYFRPNNNVTRAQASKIDANTFFPGCVTP